MIRYKDFNQLLKDIEKIPLAHYRQGIKQYLNKAKVEDLFSRTFGGSAEIVHIVKESDRSSISVGSEAGIGLPVLTEWFLKLKTMFESKAEIEESVDQIVKRELDSRWKMLLAEAVLQSEDRIQDDFQNGEFIKPYIRIKNVFQPFLKPTEEKLRESLEEFVGQEVADIIIQRQQQDQLIHPNDLQFIYAARDPFPMASILFAPPRPNLGIEGNSDACSPPHPKQNRFFFGMPGELKDDVVFVNMIYVMDVELE